MEKKKILMVTYGGVHVNVMKYVYRKMKERNIVEPYMLALTVAPNVLSKENIPFHTISEYTKLFEDQAEIIRTGKELAKIEHNEKMGIRYEDSVAYMGLGYVDLCREYGEEKANELYKQAGRKAFLPVHSMTVILKYLKPDAVVVTDSPRMEKAAAIAANILCIPVVVVNTVPLMMTNLDYGVKVCVMNEFAKEYAIKNKLVSSDKLVVTGQPIFEENTHIDYEAVERLKNDIEYKKYKNVIVYLEQPLRKDASLIETKLMEMAKEHPENFYVVKLHPNQDMKEDINEVSNYIKTRDMDLRSLLYLSNVLITNNSVSGLEGVLMGKMLIVVGIKDEIIPDYSEYGIALKATSVQQLYKRVDLCLHKTDDRMLKTMERACTKFKNKEKAAENISRVIEEILQ